MKSAEEELVINSKKSVLSFLMGYGFIITALIFLLTIRIPKGTEQALKNMQVIFLLFPSHILFGLMILRGVKVKITSEKITKKSAFGRRKQVMLIEDITQIYTHTRRNIHGIPFTSLRIRNRRDWQNEIEIPLSFFRNNREMLNALLFFSRNNQPEVDIAAISKKTKLLPFKEAV